MIRLGVLRCGVSCGRALAGCRSWMGGFLECRLAADDRDGWIRIEPDGMKRKTMSFFNSLLLMIAGATQAELARQVRYLKVENEVLRSKLPRRIVITPQERKRLLKFGAKLGKAIRQLVTIVTPDTFLRWIREDRRAKKRETTPTAKRGRPRTREQLRRLVLRMAWENEWGYARIVGEFKKLGIRSIKKSTVRNILKAAGIDPCPQRAGATWDEFVARHAASLWQCDFFSQKVLTLNGIREVFVLAFLHVETRRVILSPATLHPNEGLGGVASRIDCRSGTIARSASPICAAGPRWKIRGH